MAAGLGSTRAVMLSSLPPFRPLQPVPWRAWWRFALAAGALALGTTAAAAPARMIGAFGPSTGAFDPAGTRRLLGETQLWDSMHGQDTNAGVFQWGPFTLGSSFAVEVAGSLGVPGDSGVSLFWQDAATGQRLLLAPRSPAGSRWTLYRWSPPAPWVGRSVYLGAEDHSKTAWIGLSAPLPMDTSPRRWLPLAGLHLALFATLLLPGWAAAAWTLRRRHLTAEQFLTLALVASATAAYGLFWAYLLNRSCGLVASWSVLLAGAAGLFVGRGAELRRICAELALPLALTGAAGLMYLAVLFLYGGLEWPESVSLDRFIHNLPPDPLLPYWLSERLQTGSPVRPFFADWLSSDRPPLQSAFQLQIAALGAGEVAYQVLGTILQTWVFLGLWALLRQARIPRPKIAWVLAFLIFSGFFLLNSTFVWPKLLPAAFLLLAAALLWYHPGQSPAMIGACAGLAMAAHGGSAFALLALGCWFLLSGRAGGWRFCLVAGLATAAYLLPWSLYQHYYDPPGNRLLKWHLAGVLPVDSRSLPQTLEDAYRGLSFSQWEHAKLYNLRALFTDDGTRLAANLRGAVRLARQDRVSAAARQAASALRDGGMLHLFQAPGLLDFGLLGLAWSWLRRKGRTPEAALAGRCLLVTALCIAGWCLLMFSPGATLNHQGTYFTNCCLMVALALGALEFPPSMVGALAAAQAAFFGGVWILSADRGDFTPALLTAADPAVAGLLGLTLALTVGCLVRLGMPPRASSAPAAT
jgi:hypothetical protein